MLMKEQGDHAGAGVSEEILYRIDIPANRYDLLCLEGLVDGILVFQGKLVLKFSCVVSTIIKTRNGCTSELSMLVPGSSRFYKKLIACRRIKLDPSNKFKEKLSFLSHMSEV